MNRTGAVRAYLFDYGGTLDGEGWHWFDRMLHLYSEAGSTVPRDAIREAFYHADTVLDVEAGPAGYRLEPLLERHVGLQMEHLGLRDAELARRLVQGFCLATREGWSRAREALGRLRRRARLGVVSNFYGNLDVLLEEAGLDGLLEVVVESVRAGVAKPDPAIYRIALERLGLGPGDVAMVGDNFERDVRAARKAGLRTIWLRRGDAPPPEEGIADRVISHLAELAREERT